MSTFLCPPLAMSLSKAETMEEFFTRKECDQIRHLENRESPQIGVPAESCTTNLFFGFFFDGTKNNYVLAEKGRCHSNIARLYDCYPGISVPAVLPASTDWAYNRKNYSHFFKTYIPGVSSPFKEVKDSGEGWQAAKGAAMGYGGEARIVWALLQAINNVHRYFLKQPMLSPAETISIIEQIELNKTNLATMDLRPLGSISKDPTKTLNEFTKLLRQLHSAINQHMPDKQKGRPKKVEPGIVKTIYVSIFGFSRGATQARAFTNWLIKLCGVDASLCQREGRLTLGGFDLKIDFLGVFDTVASVGKGSTLSSSLIGKSLHGHDAWADTEVSLRIPPGIRCVHLVAAHEIRRSFPLDSISVGSLTPPDCDEVVFPGVHSDIGCGYSPREQGRGVEAEGDDMITRLPLLYMYKSARLAGVPLKLEFASDIAQRRFQIAQAAITAFNAYIGTATVRSGSLTPIMREQAKLYIQWRLARRHTGDAPLESSASFQRASTFDQNDLHSANVEFEHEIVAFEAWRAGKGKHFIPKVQPAGFDDQHENEWEEIATWWGKPTPPNSVLNFFDNYVHDSRAWFKLSISEPDSEEGAHKQLQEWVSKRQSDSKRNALQEKIFLENQRNLFRLSGKKIVASAPKFVSRRNELTDAQRTAADEYARNGKIPRMITTGREPFDMGPIAIRGGYLRFRRVYAGADGTLVTSTRDADIDIRYRV
jgi:hypothetical protein